MTSTLCSSTPRADTFGESDGLDQSDPALQVSITAPTPKQYRHSGSNLYRVRGKDFGLNLERLGIPDLDQGLSRTHHAFAFPENRQHSPCYRRTNRHDLRRAWLSRSGGIAQGSLSSLHLEASYLDRELRGILGCLSPPGFGFGVLLLSSRSHTALVQLGHTIQLGLPISRVCGSGLDVFSGYLQSSLGGRDTGLGLGPAPGVEYPGAQWVQRGHHLPTLHRVPDIQLQPASKTRHRGRDDIAIDNPCLALLFYRDAQRPSSHLDQLNRQPPWA